MDTFIAEEFAGRYGSHPLVLVDVGARGGLSEPWDDAGRHLQVVGFEPDPDEHRALVASAPPGVTYVPKALSDRPGTLRLNVTRAPRCSSVLTPNREFLDAFPESERFD